ncbi:MAG: immunoglobulin domain-containing protein [Verrucomicrobiota bacterium]
MNSVTCINKAVSRKLNTSIFVSAVSLMTMPLCSAQTNLVFNGDFEAPAISSVPALQLIKPTGWTGTSWTTIIHGAPGDPNEGGHYYVSPESGAQYVVFGSGTLTQTVTVATAGKYDLSWFENCRSSQNRVGGIPVNPYDVQIISNASGQAVYSSGQIQTEEDNGIWIKRGATVDLAVGDYILQFNSGGVYGYYCPLVDNVSLMSTSLGITTQPLSQVGYWGKSVTFSVAAHNGSPPYTYQWLKDGSPVEGATGITFTLPSVQTTDAGSYTVTVTDASSATKTSAVADLTVNPAGVSLATYAGLTIDGVIGQTYGIQATTDLNNASGWINVANCTLSQPTQIWYDSQSTTQNAKRFYRVVAGPISIP